MSELGQVLEHTLSAFRELGQQYDIIDAEKLDIHCNELESKWREIQTVLPQRVTVVQEEIDAWIQLNGKLEEFSSWLDEVKEMCEEWKKQENSVALIQNLEVRQVVAVFCGRI